MNKILTVIAAMYVLSLSAGICADKCDWDKLNREAFEHSLKPVALPERDGIPYWNMNSFQFMMPPAFNIDDVAGAAGYVFTLRDYQDKIVAEMKAASPRTPLTAIWDKVPVGNMRREILLRLAGEYRAVTIDFKEALDAAIALNGSTSYWCWDGVHVTVAGYEILARKWLRTMKGHIDFLAGYHVAE